MRTILVLGVLCGLSMPMPARGAEATVSELVALLKSKDDAARLSAIALLETKGENATEAVATLTDLLGDGSAGIRAHAAHALGQLGKAARPATPALVKLVADSDPVVRRNALGALRHIRPGPQVTVPLFAKLMEHGDPSLRHRAMAVLAEAGEEAMPFLIASLKNEKTAYWACLVLAEIGPKAKSAVPGLMELVADKRPEVRREAILALAAIGEAAAPAAAQIAQGLDDKATCAAATYALGSLGKAPDEAEAKIRKNVQDPDKVIRAASIWAMAKLHPGNKQFIRRATQSLVMLLKDPDPRARAAAAHALNALRPGPDVTLPIMAEVFKGADEKVVIGALDALAGVGPQAVPNLVSAMRFEKARPRIAYILGQMGAAAAPAVDALTVLIDDKNPETQQEALIALAKIGPAAKSAVSALSKSLQDRQGPVCYGIAYALGCIGPDAIAAKPALLKAAGSDDESIALICAWALVQIHAGCKECAEKTLPVLVRGLSNPAVQHRLTAAETLGALGALAKPAVPALKKASEDDDTTVRNAAAAALKAIGN